MELNATITIEETTLTGMIETAVSDVLESQKEEDGENGATEEWCAVVERRLDELDGFVGETSVEDLESTVDSLVNLNANETDIDDLSLLVDTLREQATDDALVIAKLVSQVKALVRCVSSFRTGLLLTTGHPNFLDDLSGDSTTHLNARHVNDDAVADELDVLVESVKTRAADAGQLHGPGF